MISVCASEALERGYSLPMTGFNQPSSKPVVIRAAYNHRVHPEKKEFEYERARQAGWGKK